MRIRIAAGLVVLALLLGGAARAQEKITFVDRVHTDPGATEFRLMTLFQDASQPVIRATLVEVLPGTFAFRPDGKTLTCEYVGDDAADLIAQLNTMNFSTTSLQKRVIQVCGKDGKIPLGTVSGAPQTFTPTRTAPAIIKK